MLDVILTNLHIKKLAWVILRRLYIVILFACLGGILGYCFADSIKSYTYLSRTGYYILAADNEQIISYENGNYNMTYNELRVSRLIIPNYVEALSMDVIGKIIKEKTGLPYSAQAISSMISFSTVTDIPVIYAYVNAPEPEIAYTVAKSLAEDIPGAIGNYVKFGTLETFEYPQMAATPYTATNVSKFTILGAAACGGLSFAVIFLLGVLDPRLRKKDEVEHISQSTVLGEIPYIPNKTKDYGAFLYGVSLNEKATEAYAKARTLLKAKSTDPFVYTVTAAEAKCGTSLTAINLALAFAAIGKKMLLIDADFRNEGITGILEIPKNMKSFTECISKGGNIEDYIVDVGKNVTLLGSRDNPETDLELLSSERVREMIRRLKEQYDGIIIDTPALAAVPDALHFSGVSDGYLFVVKANATSMIKLKKAIERTEQGNSRCTGCIINAI